MKLPAARYAAFAAAGVLPERSRRAGKRLVLLALWLLPAAGTGCAPAPGPAAQTHPLPQAVDPFRLRGELNLAMERYMAQTIGTSSRVSADTQDRHIRQVCLYWKIRALDNYLQILAVEDPRLAFMQEWFNVVRLRQNLMEGPGATIFGPDQPKIVALVRGMEADILALGRRAFPPAAIQDAQDDIEAAASQYRAQGPFDPQPLLAPQQEGHILAILTLPLAPVAGAGGMSDAAHAINRFTDAARAFSLVVQHLPERTRWQSEVLLLDMEATGPVPAFAHEMNLFEKELRDAAASFLSLPKEIREEFEKTMVVLDKTQPQLQATLAQAAAVAQQTQAAAETTRQGLLEFRQTAQTVGTVSDQLAQTAKAVSATAVEVRGLLADYGQMTHAKPPPSQPVSPPPGGAGATGEGSVVRVGTHAPGGSTLPSDDLSTSAPSDTAARPAGAAPPEATSDVQNYRAAAESVTAAAKEIRAVLSDLHQPLPTQSGVRQVAGEFRDVLDTAFWRAVLLAVVVFVLALLYRRLGRKSHDLKAAPRPPGAKG